MLKKCARISSGYVENSNKKTHLLKTITDFNLMVLCSLFFNSPHSADILHQLACDEIILKFFPPREGQNLISYQTIIPRPEIDLCTYFCLRVEISINI